jgi:hypothetical protein
MRVKEEIKRSLDNKEKGNGIQGKAGRGWKQR